MTKTKTTPTHKIDLTIHFDRENATNNAIPNKLAQIKEYLSINAPLFIQMKQTAKLSPLIYTRFAMA